MQFGALCRSAVRVPTVFAFHIITVPWKIAVSFGLGCLGDHMKISFSGLFHWILFEAGICLVEVVHGKVMVGDSLLV